VILLSNEPDLRSLFERAVGAHELLVAASGDEELQTALEAPAAAVVVSVPASGRVETWERVRKLHTGMVLVTVDSLDQTQGWPPDVARRFLVRPFGVEEIITALAVQPRILQEPAVARRRRLAKADRPWVIPRALLAPLPEIDDEPQPGEPIRRLSTGEPLWDAPAGSNATKPSDAKAKAADAKTAEFPPAKPRPAEQDRASADRTKPGRPDTVRATPDHTRTNGATPERPNPRSPLADHTAPHPATRRRAGLVAAMAVLLVATAIGSIAVGRATAPNRSSIAGRISPTPSTTTPGMAIKEKTPAACNAALADADATISYLVGNIGDQRLVQAMQRYQQTRRACRQTSR
jgi:hypothetical protein